MSVAHPFHRTQLAGNPSAASRSRTVAFPRRRQRPVSAGPTGAVPTGAVPTGAVPTGSGAGSGPSSATDARRNSSDAPRTASDALTTTATRRRPVHESVVPGTRTPAGVPRELVVDEAGKPRRSVLLAAIMIRRGRSVAEISAATGLPVDVVTCLSRSV